VHVLAHMPPLRCSLVILQPETHRSLALVVVVGINEGSTATPLPSLRIPPSARSSTAIASFFIGYEATAFVMASTSIGLHR
jgi:hypothetical protein